MKVKVEICVFKSMKQNNYFKAKIHYPWMTHESGSTYFQSGPLLILNE